MKIWRSITDLEARDSGRVRVLVPTMGALHEGHKKLICEALRMRAPGGEVVVSIFVNPLQFDRQEDLQKYPRPVKADLDLCEELGVDAVYLPDVRAFYHSDHSTMVYENTLSGKLCGAARPGHFEGVCTVVLKLFLQLGATHAVFGRKDFQQLAIVQRMVRDLSVPVQIVPVDTVRDVDGLALSSRNTRLTPSQRADAPRIYRSLQNARELLKVESATVGELIDFTKRSLVRGAPEDFRIDYVEMVDARSFQSMDLQAEPTSPGVLAVAAFYGDVRLIDHIELSAELACRTSSDFPTGEKATPLK